MSRKPTNLSPDVVDVVEPERCVEWILDHLTDEDKGITLVSFPDGPYSEKIRSVVNAIVATGKFVTDVSHVATASENKTKFYALRDYCTAYEAAPAELCPLTTLVILGGEFLVQPFEQEWTKCIFGHMNYVYEIRSLVVFSRSITEEDRNVLARFCRDPDCNDPDE